MPKKREPFNNPFRGLTAEAPRTSGKPAEERLPKRSADPDGDALLAAAMHGVRPMDRDPARVPAPPPEPAPAPDDDAEAYAQLAELVAGHGKFDTADTDEYLEGSAPGVDRRHVSALRRGEYAVQAHLDLHGLSKGDAKDAVERFLTASRKCGRRCVLVIHGRGHNSKDHIPVLKERLQVWLARGRIAQSVLAFATARPADGGAGAVYVLLRR